MKEYEKAKRLANTVVGDFFLYNHDKIDTGLRNDNLLDALAKELKESESFYNENISDDVRKNSNYLWDTFFNKLMKEESSLFEVV